ncbi:MAG: luciferase family protein [Bdellovibrionota bacterium]
MATLRKKLISELEKIPGLEDRPSKVAGGSAIFYKNKEIAHFHHDNEIDVRLTKKIIKLEGLTHPVDSEIHHHRSPSSEWIEIKFTKSEHIKEVVRLFKLALKQY